MQSNDKSRSDQTRLSLLNLYIEIFTICQRLILYNSFIHCFNIFQAFNTDNINIKHQQLLFFYIVSKNILFTNIYCVLHIVRELNSIIKSIISLINSKSCCFFFLLCTFLFVFLVTFLRDSPISYKIHTWSGIIKNII